MIGLNRIYKNLLLSALSLLLTLLLIEIALSIFYHSNPQAWEKPATRSTKPDYSLELVSNDGTTLGEPGWLKLVLHPYLIFKNAPDQHNALFNVNSLGVRGEEVSREKGEAVFRIIMLGGSATFGVGSSGDASTISYQLERRLNDAPPFSQRIEVINAGVSAYVSTQEWLLLETELIDWSPDLIIAYDGYNDFISGLYMTEGCRNPFERPEDLRCHVFFQQIESQLIAHAQERATSFPQRVIALFEPLMLKTALGKFLRERSWARPGEPTKSPASETQRSADYILDSSCVQHIVDNYQRNLAQMARVVGGYNVSLLIAVQPEIGWKKPLSEGEAKFLQSYPWHEKAASIIYPQLMEAARRVADEYGVLFIDLRAAFNERSDTLFLDGVHLNDHGNEIVAQALADYLRSDIRFNR